MTKRFDEEFNSIIKEDKFNHLMKAEFSLRNNDMEDAENYVSDPKNPLDKRFKLLKKIEDFDIADGKYDDYLFVNMSSKREAVEAFAREVEAGKAM